MSFILDALRKSETERRRTSTPMLAGVPIETARAGVPGWTWAIIGVLGVAVIGLGGAWWSSIQTSGPSTAFMPPTAGVTPDLPLAAEPAPVPNPPATGAGTTMSVTAGNRAVGGGEPVLQSEATIPPTAATPPLAATPAPSDRPAPATATPARETLLPTVAELTAAGVQLPALHLELHVYHADPASRWVYINGGRYTEGRRTVSGTLVVEIVPEGVVMNHDGRDFVLLAQ